MSYALTATVEAPFDTTLDATRSALADQGFGVLTEIDVTTTMREKLGQEMEDYVILGACNPALAHAALESDRGIGLLLPCNVVVRALDEHTSQVEAFDPEVMMSFSSGEAIAEVASDARKRLLATLEALTSDHPVDHQEN